MCVAETANLSIGDRVNITPVSNYCMSCGNTTYKTTIPTTYSGHAKTLTGFHDVFEPIQYLCPDCEQPVIQIFVPCDSESAYAFTAVAISKTQYTYVGG